MDSISINFGALCKRDSAGNIISVMITAEEYEYLCDLTGRENEMDKTTESHKILEYGDFHDLVSRTMVAEWNR